MATRDSNDPSLTATNRRDLTWACFVTTFRRPQTLAATIGSLLSQTRPPQTLLVVDNSPDADGRAVVEAFDDDRLLYLVTPENLGSAGGCAFGLRWLYRQGFEWMQLVDDDNPPATPDTCERVMAIAERHGRDERLGMVGATGQRWSWANGEYHRLEDRELVGDLDVDVVGGNHFMTVRRSVLRDVGPPDGALFFGFWELLWCLEIRRAGFRIVIDGELMHDWRRTAGRLDRTSERSLVPRDPASGVWRRYYTTRNYIDRMRTSFDRPDLARRAAVKAVAKSIAAFGRGPRYGAAYARYSTKGIVDGYRGRLGRVVEPQAKTTRHG